MLAKLFDRQNCIVFILQAILFLTLSTAGIDILPSWVMGVELVIMSIYFTLLFYYIIKSN